ncbi:hypothetical protein LCGC14_1343610 [marine sediment metagenome]|uniref:Uncharacterized protein n=1 Tax=marine sediment metagenome TaxID=412755 RepID=A0A0F9KCX3_9ZZZZ
MTVGRPVGVKDSKPRKLMAPRGNKDARNYRYPDSGCPKATRYLGHQSSCLETCPFGECSHVKKDNKKVDNNSANSYIVCKGGG